MPEPVGERRVDLERLLGDPASGLRRHRVQGHHVVQAVGELDQNDADVLGRGQDHLAEGLRLRLVLAHIGVPADLRHAVDELGDLGVRTRAREPRGWSGCPRARRGEARRRRRSDRNADRRAARRRSPDGSCRARRSGEPDPCASRPSSGRRGRGSRGRRTARCPPGDVRGPPPSGAWAARRAARAAACEGRASEWIGRAGATYLTDYRVWPRSCRRAGSTASTRLGRRRSRRGLRRRALASPARADPNHSSQSRANGLAM